MAKAPADRPASESMRKDAADRDKSAIQSR